MLKKAAKLDQFGTVDNKSEEKKAIQSWEEAYGMEIDSVETQELTYKAIEEMRRRELESKAKQESRTVRHGRRKR